MKYEVGDRVSIVVDHDCQFSFLVDWEIEILKQYGYVLTIKKIEKNCYSFEEVDWYYDDDEIADGPIDNRFEILDL